MRYGVLDDDDLRLELLVNNLRGQGFKVGFTGDLATYNDAANAVDSLVVVGAPERLADLFEPHVGRSAIGATPTILMTPRGSLGDLVGLIHGAVYGLVIFSQGIDALAKMLHSVEGQIRRHGLATRGADAAKRALTLLRGAKASGVLQVHSAGREGQILLRQGSIVDAEVGAMRGEDAAAALVAGMADDVTLGWTSLEEAEFDDSEDDDGEIEVEEVTLDDAETPGAGVSDDNPLGLCSLDGVALPALEQSALDAVAPCQVLVVDDDESIRKMVSTVLSRRGFRVAVAVDGREGLETAIRERPHLIVSDIMMPKLDGWGFLAAVRNDYRLRETPFALLSCHDEHLDYLERLGSGADAYLPKGVKLDDIVTQVRGLALPWIQLMAHVVPGVSLRGQLSRLGPMSLLRALAARNASGQLSIEDPWASYTLLLSSGMVASARADFGTNALEDSDALRSLIGVQEGRWRLEADVEPDRWSLQRDALEIVEEIAERATSEEVAVRDRLIGDTAGLVPDTSRIAFYEKVCPVALQPLVALVRGGVTPRDIVARGGTNPLVVDWLFKDMLSKGVVRFSEVT